MRFGSLTFSILLVLGLAIFHGPLGAQEQVDPLAQVRARVAARQAEAKRLLSSGKTSSALERLRRAKTAITEAIREVRQGGTVRTNPKLARELKALAERMRKKTGHGPITTERKRKLIQEFQAERKQLIARYGTPPNKPDAAALKRRDRNVGQLELLLASVEEQVGECHLKAGRKQMAVYGRQDALAARLRAYSLLDNHELAVSAAEKLVTLAEADAQAFADAATYYAERRRFPRAKSIWQNGIAGLESGKVQVRGRRGAAASRRNEQEQLVLFYRQLAFAQQQLGEANQARQSMDQAARIEAGLRERG